MWRKLDEYRRRSTVRPAVSVVIPTYDRPDLTAEAVDSVLSQSFREFELIVVDDGSPPEVVDLLRRRYSANERFRLIHTSHTGMPGAARNRGAGCATGEFLAFLDSDDMWHSEKLKLQVELHQNSPEFLWSHTHERWVRNGRAVSQRSRTHAWQGDLFADSLRKCVIGPSTVMIRRDLFTASAGFREDLEVAEDYEFWLRLTAFFDIGCVEEPLTVKRAGHGDQLSERYGYIEPFRIRGLLALCEQGFFPLHHRPEAHAELARKCGIHARGARKRGRDREAEEFEAIAASYRLH